MDTRLRMTFEQLPEQKRVLVRAAINALNGTANEVDGVLVRMQPPSAGATLLKKWKSDRAAAQWEAVPDGAHIEKAWRRHLAAVTETAFEESRQTLRTLVSTGRLPESTINDLFESYKADVNIRPQSKVIDGRVHLDEVFEFRSGIGLIHFAILQLSQLSADEPALLICAECGKFRLIQSTGGDKISRFCPGRRCANRFHQREHRKKQRERAAKAARRHK